RFQAGDLIVERYRAEMLAERTLPIVAATGGAATVERNNDKALIRQPLIQQQPVHGRLNHAKPGAAVNAHDHGVAFIRIESPWANHDSVITRTVADLGHPAVWQEGRIFSHRRESCQESAVQIMNGGPRHGG